MTIKTRLPVLLSFVFFCLHLNLQAQQPDAFHAKKELKAIRINKAPRIDGVLDDEAWKNAPLATNFIQQDPKPFAPESRPTVVKVIYDDDAVYLGAYLYDAPDSISKELSQRDDTEVNVDFFGVSFDCFQNNQNGFQFFVTAAGVQADMKVGRFSCGDGCFNDTDVSWDAVWQSAIKMMPDGWVVEMRIPYSALRFPKKPVQDWNFQLKRTIKRLNEKNRWSPQDPKIDNQILTWGKLTGLENIKPPLRLSLSPYVAATYSHVPNGTNAVGAPIFDNSHAISGGLDIKYGINESFTLDATLIPNFGQVQSDNKVLNLSPFEVKYNERRPFFTEGLELFNKGDIFYSRRVGGTPAGYDISSQLNPHEIVIDNPSETQLYNASKISGRTNGNLGIGIFNAIAAPMYATVRDTSSKDAKNSERRIQTGVLTNYNVVVLDQSFRKTSNIYFTNTNTWREGDARKANVSALQMRLRDTANRYEFSIGGRTSQIFESDTVSSGYTGNWGISKVSGNLTWNIGQTLQTDKWDPNDLGIFTGNNNINTNLGVQYQTFQPTKTFLQSQWWVNFNHDLEFKPTRFEDYSFNWGFWMRLKNQWTINNFSYIQPDKSYDIFEPRYDGKIYEAPSFAITGINIHSDSRKQLQFRFHIDRRWRNIPGFSGWSFSVAPSYRINNHLSIGVQSQIDLVKNQEGYADSNSADDIIFGRRNRTTADNSLRLSYKFNTKSNLTFAARHYWSKVEYNSFYKLNNDGTLTPREWNVNENINNNYFNIDMIYTLEFAPGSFLNLVWKNNISRYDSGTDAKVNEDYFHNVSLTSQTPQSNSFTMKLIYYVDYAKIKKIFL